MHRAERPVFLLRATPLGTDGALLTAALVTGACLLGLLVPVLADYRLRARTRHGRRWLSQMLVPDD